MVLVSKKWRYFRLHFKQSLRPYHHLMMLAAILPDASFFNIYLRPRLWRWSGIPVGRDTQIRYFVQVTSGTLSIGKNSRVNIGVHFDCASGITIGDYCQIGAHTLFETMGHTVEPVPNNVRRARPAPIVTEDYAWVGAGVIILPGVTIGRGAVVGAGAVVTKDVPPFTVVAGVPARPIREMAHTV